MAVLKNLIRELISLREKNFMEFPSSKEGFLEHLQAGVSPQAMTFYHWITCSWAGSLVFASGKAPLVWLLTSKVSRSPNFPVAEKEQSYL